MIGAGGVYPPPDGYIEAAAELCRERDPVRGGLRDLRLRPPRTWLGIDRWPVKPDMVTTAKGVTSGTVPLGALIVAPHIAEVFWTGAPGAPSLRHGQTYAGHPAACAAANTALDIYEREDLIPRGRELERPLSEALAPLRSSPVVAEVRSGPVSSPPSKSRGRSSRATPASSAAGCWSAAPRESWCVLSGAASRSRRR